MFIMNKYHTANQANWDDHAPEYKKRVDSQNVWRRCVTEPALAFDIPAEMEALRDVKGKRVAVLGSGNNVAAFALAGMGAHVTSVDISKEQLRYAKERAEMLGLKIAFVVADVTDLSALTDESFDVAYTNEHVAMWVSDLAKFHREAVRILRPGGLFVIKENHPFRTIWSETSEHMEVARPYGQRGPFLEDPSGPDVYIFNWTVADYINSVMNAGCDLVKFEECGWESTEEYWIKTPLKGLPEYLFIVGRKR